MLNLRKIVLFILIVFSSSALLFSCKAKNNRSNDDLFTPDFSPDAFLIKLDAAKPYPAVEATFDTIPTTKPSQQLSTQIAQFIHQLRQECLDKWSAPKSSFYVEGTLQNGNFSLKKIVPEHGELSDCISAVMPKFKPKEELLKGNLTLKLAAEVIIQ